MSAAAAALVVAAAVAHASWNYFAKRAGASGLLFVWLYTVWSMVLFAPAAAWWLASNGLPSGLVEWGFILGSMLIHTAYFGLLQRGYAAGDLSVVYPIARGVGPVLAIAGAVALLGERPSVRALVGGGLVCIGVVGLGFLGRTRPRYGGSQPHSGLVYAVLTGVMIASYTIWDAHAVGGLGIAPLTFAWLSMVGRFAVLSPFAWRRRAELRPLWDRQRSAVVAVGTLAPTAYLLVLVAFTLAPVSYVAPARELSIVLGTALGAKLLGEAHGAARVAAAATVLAGVALLATG